MDIKQVVITCLRDKYVDFKGRAGKEEFWWFFLAQVVVLLVAGLLSNTLYVVAALALLLPGLGAGARRLHDTGKTGWLMLLGLIPVVGFIALVYFWIQPSVPANEWGAGPALPDVAALPPGAV
ncbi:DUF805 domain-containing protein [Ramlibacter sp.]|uniref:DUF805 domain-containing protein n=1 Tax=Ramlibacter sp. TaxID=1917967 RepID=UPI001802B9F9|nr:DUF805 domain-containing protein [Ramlibacter sp.]MBA2675774.1 DUF805 domain-containing protein [Ramlibacter sp.]